MAQCAPTVRETDYGDPWAVIVITDTTADIPEREVFCSDLPWKLK